MTKRKTLKVKVPKRVAGVKIPKTVRKGPVVDFLNSSEGQALIAEALLFAAGAYAARSGDSASREGELIDERMAQVKNAAVSARVAAARDDSASDGTEQQQLARAFGEAMRAFRAALTSLRSGEKHGAGLRALSEAALARDSLDMEEIEPQRKRRPSRSRLPEKTITALP